MALDKSMDDVVLRGSAPGTGLVKRCASLLRRTADWLGSYQATARHNEELRALDDRLLRDIGINRQDLEFMIVFPSRSHRDL